MASDIKPRRRRARPKGIEAAKDTQAELAYITELCRSKPFVEALASLMAERSASFRHVLHTDGVDGLVAIAEQIGAALQGLTPSEKATAALGGQAGFCLGYAAARRELDAIGTIGTHDRPYVH